MTERQRLVVERGYRRRLLALAFGIDRPAHDDITTPGAAERALVATIGDLGATRIDGVANRVIALLDLLELDGRHIPFDAQTRFHDRFLGWPNEVLLEGPLAEIAHWLGFSAQPGRL